MTTRTQSEEIQNKLAVIKAEERQSALTFYNKIENPMAAVEKMGVWIAKSGMFGPTTHEQGMLIAMACICENQNPLTIQRKYNMVKGKPGKKSEAMLAELREAGGTYKWLKYGLDGLSAEIEITFMGNTLKYEYTIAMAKQAQLVKADGGWVKNPGNMLRARCVSDTMRMVAPEISSGLYTPEELQDIEADRVATTKPLFSKIGNDEPAEAEVVDSETPEAVEAEVEVIEDDSQNPPPPKETKAPAAKKKAKKNMTPDDIRVELKKLYANKTDLLDEYCVEKQWIQAGGAFPEDLEDDIAKYFWEFRADVEGNINEWFARKKDGGAK